MTSTQLPAAPREPGAKSLTYMPQLDGLRTIAVSLVILQHFGVLIGGAGYGVHLFFVLSGFLITGILLAERRNVDELGITRFRAFRQFYVRRALRIFPLYYFIVISGVILNVDYAREYAPWLFSYTINLKMAAQGWYIDNFGHFWSLAIEEQYYLIWPWLILLLPRKWLVRAAVITILIAPVYRFIIAALAPHENWAWVATYIGTPSAMDSLGMGSLLSIALSREATAARVNGWMRYAIPLVALPPLLILQFGPHGIAHMALLDFFAAMLFSWLIYRASRGFRGLVGKFLSATPIVYLGRISYGLYVYHPLVRGAVTKGAPHIGVQLPLDSWQNTVVSVLCTVFAATVSWYVLERPLNELKRKFPYKSREATRPLAPRAATVSEFS